VPHTTVWDLWDRVPIWAINPDIYGRTVDAYMHFETGALLLHHKPLSRHSATYHKTGVWMVTYRRKLVGRRYYYGGEILKAPIAWATKTIETKLLRKNP
jgi:hypothetical protein